MTSFLNGIDCGPSNPLKSAANRLDRGPSVFQDRLISTPNVAGPSSRRDKASQHPATRLNSSRPAAQASTPFDLSEFQVHLPSQSRASPSQNGSFGAPSSSTWSQAFLSTPPAQSQTKGQGLQRQTNGWQDQFAQFVDDGRGGSSRQQSIHRSPASTASHYMASAPPWQRFQDPYSPHASTPVFPLGPTYVPMELERHAWSTRHISDSQSPVQEQDRARSLPAEPLTDAQEVLAQTASAFVDNIHGDLFQNNPKLAGSRFMELVNAVSKKEVVVQEDTAVLDADEVGEGAKFVTRVTQDWASDFAFSNATADGLASTFTENTQTGPSSHPVARPMLSTRILPSSTGAIDDAQIRDLQSSGLWEQQFAAHEQDSGELQQSRSRSDRGRSVHFDETAIREQTTELSERHDEMDFDEATFNDFNSTMRQAQSPRIGVGDLESWGDLQRERERLDEQSSRNLRGMNADDRYLFQSGNPYRNGVVDAEVFGQESLTFKQGVLELEAAVQADPQDHAAWYALGLRQQENEREDQAILALSKAIQLDPESRPQYLALAVSYTNEGDPGAANVMLDKWLDLGDGRTEEDITSRHYATLADERRVLTERLIEVARRHPEELDPEVQIALGVLFNSSEEYKKAEDCFLAALSARPDDWLLYNRLGATLANSGRSADAISYYQRALELHPNFVRALFNLGIAYINLGQYDIAAQQITDALRLQLADSTQGYAFASGVKGVTQKGVTSEVLWVTLRNACMRMGRQDLVDLALRKDLSGFPADLAMHSEEGMMAEG